ncbi:MAG: uncharacterized protein QOD74_1692 [Variibacter sp.]|jgi:uncharacterized membrane protein YfcA|nr:uncharacterized protein [Variibacter sp.]
MIFGLPGGEVALLAVGVLVGGAVTGLMAGLFGVGGGAIIVPVLYEIFRALGVPEEVRIQLCVGTSLAIIVPTSLRSFVVHRASGALPVEILKQWAIPVVIGVVLGSAIAAFAPAAAFKFFFVVLASLIAAKMLLGRENWRLGAELPGRTLMAAFGLFIGLYASLMGVGGGAVGTLILTLYGRSIHAAVAVSAGLGVLISTTGTIGFILAGLPRSDLLPPLSLGFVSLIGFVLMAPVTSFIAPFGARLAHALPKRQLEVAFGCFLLAVAIRFLFSLL